MLADVLDEVDRVVESALGRLPLFHAARGVTAEGEDVAAARVVCFLSRGDGPGKASGSRFGSSHLVSLARPSVALRLDNAP